MQMKDVVGDEIGQVAIFRVIPALFDGIQLRRIGRQPLEIKPIGMIFFEIRRRRPMHRPAIPNHDYPTTAMLVQFLQKPDGFVGIDICRRDVEI
jgi:hypothetical protein